MLKTVAGVFPVRPILPKKVLTLRKSRRRGHELVQQEGETVQVVAISDDKPGLLSFAAINGIPVKNYTDTFVSKPEPKINGKTVPGVPEVPELSI